MTIGTHAAVDLHDIEAPDGAERIEAVDAETRAVLGTIDAAAPGERLTRLAAPGEVDVVAPDIAVVGADVTRTLLENVVVRATARYASGVILDTAGASDGLRLLLRELGFRPETSRGPAVFIRDLTLAADGTRSRVLDNPALASLNGHHARFAERRGEIVRYQPDVSPWTGFPDAPTAIDWVDAAALLGSGAFAGVGAGATLPEGWTELEGGGGFQLTGEAVEGRPDPEAVELTPDDVPDILDLVAHAKPGPYLPRTIELGRYVGFREDGRLIALAGERLHPPGWTEISAVSTDAQHRGRGLATRLVLDVVHGIRQRGDLPLLHAAATNTGAVRLYEHLGFRQRKRPALRFVRVP
ncbi:hypothetical protein GCM10025867_42570 [Frondihabitans sucicola]|uniref:N-acetyltransferase domain-containing protein n=1 Tax=Frondihabitans sucicola TaxID=1268041 RepID=A0ABM8GU91_9MICO|nr:GNAT family N-acetyltransferase [Frondihabitans sucicola]BDZ52016.1 hypothetical protein GCM10025867_42570 [Frondihabitans sucicola]